MSKRAIANQRGFWHDQTVLSAVACAGTFLAACVGTIGGSASNDTSSTADAGAEGAAAVPESHIGPGAATDKPVAVPFAHLTAAQYQGTMADLFAPIQVPQPMPPADVVVDGFDNNASAQSPTAALLDAYHNGAVAAANAAMKNSAMFLGCSPASRADEDACANTFLGPFAKKAYRRPLAPDEIADLNAFYARRRTAGDDFATAMTLSVETVLQSPYFLYRVEIGAPIQGQAKVVRLSAYEMASRLSYLLWNTMPDDALFASADSGALSDPAGIEKEVRRMLSDRRAHAAVVRFHRGWLRFDVMKTLTKDPTTFPQFTPQVAKAMNQSAEQFVDGVFFNGGTLATLFTDSHAWVNDDLAPLYGVKPPGSSTLALVQVDPTQRSGILTNAGLMAGFAHTLEDSPVKRGVFVLDRIMCAPMPSPPPGVNTTPPTPPADAGAPMTNRDVLTNSHVKQPCAACHHTIDGIGFGFDHYDAIGAYRTTDNGAAVDSSGWFPSGQLDLNGTFKDAIDLTHQLANSESVQACVVSNWLRYALGVDHTGVDIAALVPILQSFRQNNLDLQGLVVTIAKSDAFRTRLIGN